jgi:hypothetical protein
MLDTSVIKKNLPKVKKSPNGRRLAQSDHPMGED